MKRITLVALLLAGILFLTVPQPLEALTLPPETNAALHEDAPDGWGVKAFPSAPVPSDSLPSPAWLSVIPTAWVNDKTPKYRIIFTAQETTLQKCAYSADGSSANLHYVYRDRLSMTVKVMDATLQNYEIASRTFVGSEPPACLDSVYFAKDEEILRQVGGWPNIEPYQTWLATVMQGKRVTAHPLQPRLKLTAHKLPIVSVSFSADSKYLATTSEDQVVYIWYTVSGKIFRSLKTGHTGKVNVASFSPDGKFLVTGGADKSLRMWNLANGKQVFVSDQHKDPIVDIQFSPDGTLLATLSGKNVVSFIDVATGEIKYTATYRQQLPILLIKFSDDGQQLVGITSNNYLFTWSATSGIELGRDAMSVKGLTSLVALSPDGQRLVTKDTSQRFLPTLANVKSAQDSKLLQGHKGKINAIRFSADARYIVTASMDSTARVWDATTGEDLLQLPYHMLGVSNAVFSPDGKYIVTTSPDNIGRLWQLPKEFVPVPPKK